MPVQPRAHQARHGGHHTLLVQLGVLRSGAEAPDHLTVCGGPAAFVESQIRRVEDVLAGREETDLEELGLEVGAALADAQGEDL